MSLLTRRQAIVAASAGAMTAMVSSTQAAPQSFDKDIDLIETRLLNVSSRGKGLSTERKFFVLLAVCAAQAIPEEMTKVANLALKQKVVPIAMREAVYQTAPYVGIGRVQSVLPALNAAFKKAGVKLPLISQTTVSDDNRLEKGIEVQVSIFGDHIKSMHQNAPEGQKALIIDDLSGYCFGDFYTRKGMSIKDRELVVFSAIAALGGCESQLNSHAQANLKEGNTKQDLIDALQIAVPLNGFPRTLNALAIVNALK